jgi:hypothetical protein
MLSHHVVALLAFSFAGFAGAPIQPSEAIDPHGLSMWNGCRVAAGWLVAFQLHVFARAIRRRCLPGPG